MEARKEVTELRIERLDIRGMPAEKGARYPAGELPVELIVLLLRMLYPYVRKPTCESVMLDLGSFFLVNAGLRREGTCVTIDGTVDAQDSDETYIAFQWTIQDPSAAPILEAVILDMVDGTGYIGRREPVLALAVVEGCIKSTQTMMVNTQERVDGLLERLKGSERLRWN